MDPDSSRGKTWKKDKFFDQSEALWPGGTNSSRVSRPWRATHPLKVLRQRFDKLSVTLSSIPVQLRIRRWAAGRWSFFCRRLLVDFVARKRGVLCHR